MKVTTSKSKKSKVSYLYINEQSSQINCMRFVILIQILNL